MTHTSGSVQRGVAGALLAALAVILPGGVLAATVVGGGPSSTVDASRGVGATGFGVDGVEVEPNLRPSNVPTTVTTVAPAPSSTVAIRTAPTAPVRATGATSTTTTPPPVTTTSTTAVPQAGIPPTTVPRINSWSAARDGVAARIRMEPAAPVAGEQVRFFIDITSERGCCIVYLEYGDGSEPMKGGGTCATSAAGTTIVVTHTYAAPGSYSGRLIVASIPCQPMPTLPGGAPAPPMIYGPGAIGICVVVGPEPARPSC